jgi:hypothetical protein
MEKKLYRVRVVLYVMAENQSDACVAATRARFDIFECAAKRVENVDPEWKDAIPYNTEDERTCSEIMTNKQDISRPEPPAVRLPAYLEAGIHAFESNNPSVQPGQQP